MSEVTKDIVQEDMVVLLDYTLTVDGEEVDTGPILYLQGYNNIISGLETALIGMKTGESKEILVNATDAYGEYDEESVVNVSRDSFPADFEIHLGRPMRIRDQGGHIFTGTVIALSEDSVELDLNHPLAGKDLAFKATIMDLRHASPLEIEQGRVQSGCASCGPDGCSPNGCG